MKRPLSFILLPLLFGLLGSSSGFAEGSFGDAAGQASNVLGAAAMAGGGQCAGMMMMASQMPEEQRLPFMLMAMQSCNQASQYAAAQKNKAAITQQMKAPDVQKMDVPAMPKVDPIPDAQVMDVAGALKTTNDAIQNTDLDTNAGGDLPAPQSPDLASLLKAPAASDAPLAGPVAPPATSVPKLEKNVTTEDTAKSGAGGTLAGSGIGLGGGLGANNKQSEPLVDRSPAQYAEESSSKRTGAKVIANEMGSASGDSGSGEGKKEGGSDELLMKLLGGMNEEKPPAQPEEQMAEIPSGDKPNGQFEHIFQYASFRYHRLVKEERVREGKKKTASVASPPTSQVAKAN